MNKVVVGQKLIHYSGGYGKTESDGTFTEVTHVTPTGRFRVKADNEKGVYHPDSLQRMGKTQKWSGTPYCRLINEDNKALEQKAMKRLWINRLKTINFETLSSEQLSALIGTLNTKGIK